MKLYAVHKDGKLTDSYHAEHANDKESAEIEFITGYCRTPEQAGVKLVEYTPVNPATEKLVEAVMSATLTLLNALPFDDTFIQKHRPFMFALMQDTQQKLGYALNEYEATK